MKGKHLEKTDGISELPDELLISILSCLSLKEAAKTCVLSHRWEKLWTFTTGVLDFGDIDSLKYLDKVADELDSEELNYQRSKFTDWVNQIIKLHQGHSIDEFRLLFYLDSSSSCEINKWIEFALSKGVKRLKLDLASLALRKDVEKWTFPRVDKLIYARQNTKPCVTSSFQYQLTDITLRDVNIAQEAIEYLLLNSPFLEQLSVFGSSHLVNLRVSGPVLKLKALQISTCSNIKRVEISVASLISFSYFGPKIIMLIQNVPHLSNLSVGGDYCWLFIEKIWQHVSYLPQLKRLWLSTGCEEAQPGLLTPVKFPEFRNLTQLGVSLHSPYYKCITWITSFIGSCPLLHTLTLWLNHCGHSQVQFCDMSPSFKERVQNARKCRHECLKVVELMDFRWLRTDVALATWLLETAVSLEKLILEPEFGHCMPPEETQAHTENVMKLKKKLPSGAKLVIGK